MFEILDISTIQLSPEILIMVLPLNLIGYCIKKIPVINDSMIPILLTAIAIVGSICLGYSPLDGIIASGLAVATNQGIKQIGKGE